MPLPSKATSPVTAGGGTVEDPNSPFCCRHSLTSYFKLPTVAEELLYIFFHYVHFMIDGKGMRQMKF